MGKEKQIISHKETRAKGDTLKLVGCTFLCSLGVAWICFDSFWGLLSFVVCFPFCSMLWNHAMLQKRQKVAMETFKELMLLVSTYLQAGYSIENAFVGAEGEMENMQIEQREFLAGLKEMNQKVSVSVPIEKAVFLLANTFGIEEGYEFADLLLVSKRLGGNYNKNIKRAAEKISQKMDIYQEIEVILAEKNLELRIMMAMPVIFLAYMKIASYDFIAALYHNSVGIFIMSVCLVFYLGFVLLSKKIVKIEV